MLFQSVESMREEVSLSMSNVALDVCHLEERTSEMRFDIARISDMLQDTRNSMQPVIQTVTTTVRYLTHPRTVIGKLHY